MASNKPGPGNYESIIRLVQRKTFGEVVCVAVIGGNKGNGFGVMAQGDKDNPTEAQARLRALAGMLRFVADELDATPEEVLANALEEPVPE